MVASDRISTYDVVHPTPIPDKGKVLTGLSVFWFERTERDRPQPPHLGRPTACPRRRAAARMVVRKLEMLPVECVVRGYITGSGWKDYQPTGAVCGIELPRRAAGVRAAARAALHAGHQGRRRPRREHRLRGRRRAGRRPRAGRARARRSLALYAAAAEHARASGIILADTKFEFGLDADGTLVARRRGAAPPTPRASGRPTAMSRAARQPSFDKQYVRDWASAPAGTSKPPAPEIPDDVVARTRRATSRPTSGSRGEPFDAWLGSERTAPDEGARACPAQGRHPRSAGPDRRAGAAGAGLRGRRATSASAA